MSDSLPALPTRQRIKWKILLPMGLGLLIFLALYIASTFWYLDREIKRDLKQKLADINFSFDSLLDQRAQVMLVQLEQLAESAELQQLMLQQDRKQLLKASQATFRRLLVHLHISHFYFHSPDKKVFLRVHNPERHSDLITRYSLRQAAETQKPAYGIELGPLGTFTLRTVIPWYQEDRLLGYLELGEEIELLINNFFQLKDTVLVHTISKKYLDREKWTVGMQMLDKDPSGWDLLEDRIVVQSSQPELLPEIVTALRHHNGSTNDTFKIDYGNKNYQGQLQPLLDSAGHRVGDFIVLRDVTTTLDEYWGTVFVFSGLCLLSACSFLFFTSALLGRTENELKDTDQQLVDEMLKVHLSNQQLETEIEERKTAEAKLNQIHDELEERVNERTEQLWLALEQTQQVRKQLSDIVSSVPDGLIVVNTDKQLLLVNLRAEELFQCRFDECADQPLRSIIRDPSIVNKMEEALQQQLNDFRFEVVQIASDLQTSISLQIRTSTLTDNNGKSIGMIYLIHDISQEREIERMKSEFITTAVHELSTPLTAILGFSEFLLENPKLSEKEKKEFLSIINEKADFLSGLVGELLDISRIESGKPLPLQKYSYTAKNLFEKPIQHLHQLSADHKFIINLEAPDTELMVDKEKIWQVMENLCSNAVKYSPVGGEVRISGQAAENHYRVTVSDQGVGLTKDQTAKVFEKFYRCNQSDTSIGGTGLGLTIVKYIIESHDGQIWIDSELGKGTEVHFVLPIHS